MEIRETFLILILNSTIKVYKNEMLLPKPKITKLVVKHLFQSFRKI